MTSPGLAILLILAAGAVFVLLPTVLSTFYDYRSKRSVICPELRRRAQIGVDAGRAARSSIFGRLRLRVESCTFWPERSGCGEACLQGLDTPPGQFPA
jgi:hypothetical protein